MKKYFAGIFILGVIAVFAISVAADAFFHGLINPMGGQQLIGVNSVYQGYQGGTGISTTTAGNVGKALVVASSSPFLTYELSSTAGIGTVTSVDMTVPTGLSISGNPVTTAGTLALTFTGGYSISKTASTTEGSTAYSWGNHALEGYLTSYSESDPVFLAASTSLAYQPIGSYLTAESDPVWLAASSSYSLTTHLQAVNKGGTGTTTTPSYGQLLMGNNSSGYDLVSTSSLGITGGAGSGTVNSGTAGQVAFYNSSGTAVSGTSTILIGTDVSFSPKNDFIANINASRYFIVLTGGETPVFTVEPTNLRTTLINASTTNLTVSTNSYLGTIKSGLWNGTAITNSYIASSTEFLVDTNWNGGSTGLVAATGRTSLGLGTMALEASSTYYLASNPSGYISSVGSDATWTLHNSYPANCAGVVVGLGDVLTCTASSTWDTAYTDRLKWDGGATGLTAATGRTSLGLGTMALEANTGSTTITTLGTIGTGTWNAAAITNTYIASSSSFLPETTSTIGTLINGSTATTAPADTDRFSFSASSLLRYITWSNIKATLKTYFDTLYGAITGQVWTGAHDFGGATLEIPNGTSCVVSGTAGKTCIDTTSDQVQYYGTATRTISSILTPSFTIASTTLTGGAATSTIPLGYAGYNETWSSAICGSVGGTGVGTTTLRFGDGTNYSNTITATSTAYDTTLSSNNAFTLEELRYLQVITTAGSPNYITCTIHKTIDSD